MARHLCLLVFLRQRRIKQFFQSFSVGGKFAHLTQELIQRVIEISFDIELPSMYASPRARDVLDARFVRESDV